MDQPANANDFKKSNDSQHERLKKAIEKLQTVNPKLTFSQIMKEVGYSGAASHLSEMISGKKKITNKFLNLLQAVYLIDREWIRTGNGEMITKPAVLVNSSLLH